MGFFKKIFKGIGKVFRKIGKGIKKAFKSVGKFMNKIGIVGQLGMMFLFPGGIGNALLKGLGNLGTTLSAVQGTGIFSQAIQGVGKILTGAKNFVAAAKTGFSSITNGIKEFGKTALNKIPGVNIEGAAANFFEGTDTAFSRTQAGFESAFGEAGDLLKGDTLKLRTDVKDINDLSNKVGIGKDKLLELNPDLGQFGDESIIPSGTNINTSLKDLYGTNQIDTKVVQEAMVNYESNVDFLRNPELAGPEKISSSFGLEGVGDPMLNDLGGVRRQNVSNVSEVIKNKVDANTVEDPSLFTKALDKATEITTGFVDEVKDRYNLEQGVITTAQQLSKDYTSLAGDDELEFDYDTPSTIVSAPVDAFYEPDRDASFLAGYNTNNYGIGSALNQYQSLFQYTPFQPFSIQPTPFMRS